MFLLFFLRIFMHLFILFHQELRQKYDVHSVLFFYKCIDFFLLMLD
jgi:hypothetical protein